MTHRPPTTIVREPVRSPFDPDRPFPHRQSFSALTRPELMDLLQAAGSVLAATGSAVALGYIYGAPDAAAMAG